MVNIEDYVNKQIEIFPDLIKILDKNVKKFQKKMKKSKDFFGAFAGFFSIILDTFEEFAKDFEHMGMTSQEFMDFGESHKEEIEAYLENHPELKEKMGKYTTEFDSLTKQE